MKKKKDVFIKSSVHTWNTNLKDQMEDWAKMFVEARKNKKVISRGTHYHYVTSKPRCCASASMSVIVLDPKKKDKFFKKKTRKKK